MNVTTVLLVVLIHALAIPIGGFIGVAFFQLTYKSFGLHNHHAQTTHEHHNFKGAMDQ
jgi:hypothetical protein